MAYTSLAELTERYGARMLIGLTDRGEVATGEIDTDTVDRGLSGADAMIDGYLAARYDLPLAQTPALVADIAQAIAIWKLHPHTPPDKIEADYKDAVSALDKLSRGIMRLDLAGNEPDTNDAQGVQITDRERPMTENNLKGFI